MAAPAGTSGQIPDLSWLAGPKLLELISHDINNMAHASISYLDLASEPGVPQEARAKFLRLSKEIVRRASLFTPNLHAMCDLRDAPLEGLATAPLQVELATAVAKRKDRFPDQALEFTATGDALPEATVGGKFASLAFYHLVDNAARFASPTAPGRLHVEATIDGQFVRLTFQDQGRGFSPGQEAYAARRFSEVGRVSGAGLGLATVRLLAERTSGALHLSNHATPRGARVELRLRRAGLAR